MHRSSRQSVKTYKAIDLHYGDGEIYFKDMNGMKDTTILSGVCTKKTIGSVSGYQRMKEGY
jgi:hypothetical protein